MSTSKVRYEKWSDAQIARSTEFVACQSMGRGQYVKRPAVSITEARDEADKLLADNSQPVLIYAVTPDRVTVYVETRR